MPTAAVLIPIGATPTRRLAFTTAMAALAVRGSGIREIVEYGFSHLNPQTA